jgi:urease accessory protein
MTAPMYLDSRKKGMAFVYVQNPTGGLFAGDRLHTRLELEAGATVHLTTQAATKVYRMDRDHGLQATQVVLGPNSYLEHIPELVIPHAGSRFVQTIEIQIAETAAFFSTEVVAPGRLARGERFEYSLVDMRTRVVHTQRNETVVADTLRFDPPLRRPDRRGLMGRYGFVGMALALAPGRDVHRLAQAIDSVCSDRVDAAAAACVLPSEVGVAVRALAHSHRALRELLNSVWATAREMLVGAAPPPRRK